MLLFVYVGMGLYLYLAQKSLIYYPTSYITAEYKNMTMHNDGESINVIVSNEGKKSAIIYFGGNAEAMAITIDNISSVFPDFTLYLMDYRGYGRSTGEASEEALYSDALKLYDTIQSKHENIAMGGRSLGSGIATYVASKREVSKLALITPYDSIVSVAQGQFPLYPAALILHDKYDSISHIKEIKAQTLVLMAEKDRIIPKVHTQKLINAFDSEQLNVVTIKNRGHNDISSDEMYYKTMQDFVGQQ